MGGKKIVFVPGERVPGTSWTVLQEAESKNGERMYKCRCDCGTIRTVNAKNLKYGKSLSCGCRKPESNKGWFSIKEKNNIFPYMLVITDTSRASCVRTKNFFTFDL